MDCLGHANVKRVDFATLFVVKIKLLYCMVDIGHTAVFFT